MVRTCGSCFREYDSPGPCPHCGFDEEKQQAKYPLALRPGTILNGRYIIGKVLGQGGFGVTYMAQDYQTKETVAIKEYLPTDFAGRTTGTCAVQIYSGDRQENFAFGKKLFLDEAETLANFIGNRHIVQVYSYFEENGTAYFAMEYVDGMPLNAYAASKGGRLDVETAARLLMPLMSALDGVHAKGIVHRDIAPDNILVQKDGTAKLIDFGAARYSTGEKSKSLDVVIKHGFAPYEQYTRHGKRGPFTDVYAMGATFYYVLTGKVPPESVDRMSEELLIPPSTLGVKINDAAEDALLKALEVRSADRWQTMGAFRDALDRALFDTQEQQRQREAEARAEEEERKRREAQARLKQEAAERKAHLEKERREHEEAERFERERKAKQAREEAERKARQEQERREREARDRRRAAMADMSDLAAIPVPRATGKLGFGSAVKSVILSAVYGILAGGFAWFALSGIVCNLGVFPGVTTMDDTLLLAPFCMAAMFLYFLWRRFREEKAEAARKQNRMPLTVKRSSAQISCLWPETQTDGRRTAIAVNGRWCVCGELQSGQSVSAPGGEARITMAEICNDNGKKQARLLNETLVDAGGKVLVGSKKHRLVVLVLLLALALGGWYLSSQKGLNTGNLLPHSGQLQQAGQSKQGSLALERQDTVAAGGFHSLVLHKNGKVKAAGNNLFGQCEVSDWKNIVDIAAGYGHSLGLHSDGTVVAAGPDYDSCCDVGDWANITGIAAGWNTSYGLRSDGTVVAAGNNSYGQCNISGWTDIVAVAAGFHHAVGLHRDGTVVAAGDNQYGQCNVSGWTDIVAVAVCPTGSATLGLRRDGTVVGCGLGMRDGLFADWTDIIAVAACSDDYFGLRADGTVCVMEPSQYTPYYGVRDAAQWTNIKAIAAGAEHVLGFRADGTVLALGNNDEGQCSIK